MLSLYEIKELIKKKKGYKTIPDDLSLYSLKETLKDMVEIRNTSDCSLHKNINIKDTVSLKSLKESISELRECSCDSRSACSCNTVSSNICLCETRSFSSECDGVMYNCSTQCLCETRSGDNSCFEHSNGCETNCSCENRTGQGPNISWHACACQFLHVDQTTDDLHKRWTIEYTNDLETSKGDVSVSEWNNEKREWEHANFSSIREENKVLIYGDWKDKTAYKVHLKNITEKGCEEVCICNSRSASPCSCQSRNAREKCATLIYTDCPGISNCSCDSRTSEENVFGKREGRVAPERDFTFAVGDIHKDYQTCSCNDQMILPCTCNSRGYSSSCTCETRGNEACSCNSRGIEDVCTCKSRTALELCECNSRTAIASNCTARSAKEF